MTRLFSHRGWRAVCWLAGTLAVLCLLMWGVVRLWGAAWLAAPLERSLGRAVTIEAVDWYPWSLRAVVRGLQLAGSRPGQPLLSAERVELALSPASLWRGRIVVRALQVQAPRVQIGRTAAGHYDVDDLVALATKPSSARPLPWSVHNIRVQDGRIDFRDEPLGLTHQVRALRLEWPYLSSAPADVEVVTRPHLSFELNGDAFALQAETTPFAADHETHAQLDVPRLDLQRYRGYWPAAWPWQPVAGLAQLRIQLDFEKAPALRLRLQGELNLTDTHWRSGSANAPQADVRWDALKLRLDSADPLAGLWRLPDIRLEGLRATTGAQSASVLAIGLLHLTGLQLNTTSRTVQADALEIRQPDVHADRNARGQWAWERLLPPPPDAPAAQASPEPAWDWSLARLLVDEGRLSWRDEATPQPVALQWSQWALQMENLRSAEATAVPLQLSWRWEPAGRRDRTPPGRAQYQGQMQLAAGGVPVAVQGQLMAAQWPLHAVAPYADAWLQARLLRGWLDYKGRLDLAWQTSAPDAQLTGNLALNGVRLRMPAEQQDVLRWDALQLRGLDVQVRNGQLQRLTLEETALVDYAMQAQLDATGRLNLLDLVRQPAQSAAPVAPTTTPATGAAAAVPAAAVPIRLGPVSLVQGKVQFRDDYVKPAYSVDLAEVTGSIGAFSNQPGPDGVLAPAQVLLRGRGEGTADLEIRGQVQPLARPVVLDLQGRLRGLDLAPLTGYSSRLTGYGIERGKLSLDARYRVDEQGLLQASNRIVLNQLIFGDRQEGEGVPNWPVKLAVSLLADRDGVVEIELPIRGSLNDPQFSVGGIIVRLLFNLVGKAIISPLSLIAAAFGQGDEITQVLFEPGRADIAAPASATLDQLVALVRQRNQWVLSLQGEADAAAEQTAYRRARLMQMVQAQKEQRSPAADPATRTPVSEQEWPGLLRQVYLGAKISKPRNLIGMVRDLPVQDMESLLLASIPVDEAAMQALAQARARAVRDALLARGMAAEQMFLASPKLHAPDQKWTPRVQLQLEPR
jgi:hypothetical protein